MMAQTVYSVLGFRLTAQCPLWVNSSFGNFSLPKSVSCCLRALHPKSFFFFLPQLPPQVRCLHYLCTCWDVSVSEESRGGEPCLFAGWKLWLVGSIGATSISLCYVWCWFAWFLGLILGMLCTKHLEDLVLLAGFWRNPPMWGLTYFTYKETLSCL